MYACIGILTRYSTPEGEIQGLDNASQREAKPWLIIARTVKIPIFLSIFSSCSFLTCMIHLMNAFSHAYSLMLDAMVSPLLCDQKRIYLRIFASSSLMSLVR